MKKISRTATNRPMCSSTCAELRPGHASRSPLPRLSHPLATPSQRFPAKPSSHANVFPPRHRRDLHSKNESAKRGSPHAPACGYGCDVLPSHSARAGQGEQRPLAATNQKPREQPHCSDSTHSSPLSQGTLRPHLRQRWGAGMEAARQRCMPRSITKLAKNERAAGKPDHSCLQSGQLELE